MATDLLLMTELYEILVEDESTIDPGVQAGMVTNLIAGEKFYLLEKFAQRPDLAPYADELLGKCENRKVIAAWVSRPDRNPDQVVARILREKRLSVIIDLIKNSKLPEEAQRSLLSRNSRKITKALLESGNLSVEVRKKLLPQMLVDLERTGVRCSVHSVLDSRHHKQAADYFEKLVNGDPGVASNAIALARGPLCVNLALKYINDKAPEMVSDAVSLIVARIDEITKDPRTIDGGGSEWGAGLGADSLLSLLEFIGLSELTDPEITKMRTTLGRLGKNVSNTNEEALKRVRKLYTPSSRTTLSAALNLATTKNVREAKATIRKLISRRAVRHVEAGIYYDVALKSLSANTVLPPEVIIPVIGDLPHKTVCAFLLQWMERGYMDAVAGVVQEETSFAYISEELDQAINYYYATGGVAKVMELKEAMCRASEKDDYEEADWLPLFLTHKLLRSDPKLVLSVLPWKAVSDFIRELEYGVDQCDDDDDQCDDDNDDDNDDDDNGGKGDTNDAPQTTPEQNPVLNLVAEIHGLLVKHLASDPVKWSTFAGLSDEFDGTLPQLLFAAENL